MRRSLSKISQGAELRINSRIGWKYSAHYRCFQTAANSKYNPPGKVKCRLEYSYRYRRYCCQSPLTTSVCCDVFSTCGIVHCYHGGNGFYRDYTTSKFRGFPIERVYVAPSGRSSRPKYVSSLVIPFIHSKVKYEVKTNNTHTHNTAPHTNN